MLTKEHSICGFDRGRLVPDCLDKRLDAAYVGYAEQMLELYRGGIGQMLGELRRKVERIFDQEEGCHPRRIKAFIKILEDASDFEIANEVEKPWKLRLKVFKMAGERHPLVKVREELHEHSSESVKVGISEKLARPWPEIEDNLYADVLDFHVLKKFKGPTSPQELLSEYNVAQAQAALFNAAEMRVIATQDYRTILTAGKLADLVAKIEKIADDKYRFTFTGAASDLRITPRYGAQMAKLLRTVLRTKGWAMEADILLRNNRRIRYRLDACAGLGSHLSPFDIFDSSIEQAFFAKWDGKVRNGWSLLRESRVLHQNQTAFFPDFLLKHEDGREILLEIVGHWKH
jgi:predicted nuclease of restriction endonuclease-like RecB superfamily